MKLKNAAVLLFCVVLQTSGCAGSVPTNAVPASGAAPMGGGDIAEQYHFHHRRNPAPTDNTAPSPALAPAPAPVGGGIGVPWIEGQTYAGWANVFTGYGTVQLASPSSLSLNPTRTTSALVTSTASFGDLNATLSAVTTLTQLKSTPDSWEVAWVLWHYTDAQHFYYLLLMPTGWELGKEDPAYPGSQRYLVTSGANGAKFFPTGVPYDVQIVQTGPTIQVSVNGASLVKYTDTETPYMKGNIGLYTEEASVSFGGVTANGSQIPY
jgi:hypothetical protein